MTLEVCSVLFSIQSKFWNSQLKPQAGSGVQDYELDPMKSSCDRVIKHGEEMGVSTDNELPYVRIPFSHFLQHGSYIFT